MRSLSDALGQTVAKRIRIEEGVALRSFHGVIPIETIAAINEIIDRSFGDTPQRTRSGEIAAELIRRGEVFRKLEETICDEARERAANLGQIDLPLKPFHVLRCASKDSGAESNNRHYDSHLLTFLIPLQLAPDGISNGDLVMYRHPRLSVTTPGNMICKMRHGFLRSLPLYCRRWLTLRDLRRGRCSRIPVQVGSVYAFNGFAIQHGNLDVEVGQRRTLLIHYYDPGHSLGLSDKLRRERIPTPR